MVICTVCKGTQFTNHSGLYYCNSCHTQVHGWTEEETDFNQYIGTPGLYKKVKGVKKGDITLEDSRLSTTWEAMNIILATQVNEMETMPGVAPSFRFFVLSLWTRYLHNQKLAFLTDKKLPLLEVVSCKRDFAALTSTRITGKKRKKCAQSSTSNNPSASEITSTSGIVSQEQEMGKFSSIVHARKRGRLKSRVATEQYIEEHHDSGSSFTGDQYDIASIVSSSGFTTSSVSAAIDRVYQPTIRTLEHIWNRERLAGLLYLGLLLSQSEAQLSDLLRWIREGHISYLRVKHLLPVEFQVRPIDPHIFEMYMYEPTVPALQKWITNLCFSLGIHEIPVPDIRVLAARYIKDLNLPDCLTENLQRLLSMFSIQITMKPSSKRRNSSECKAMAYVLVLLKLLFGLDDVTEQQLSLFAYTKNIQGDSKQQVFVWNEWVEFIEARNALLSQCFFWAKQNFDTSDSFTHEHFTSHVDTFSVHKDFIALRHISEAQNNILKSQFSDLASKNIKPPENVPSLLPMTTSTNIAMKHLQVNANTAQVLQRDFSSHHIPQINIDSNDFLIRQSTQFNALKTRRLVKVVMTHNNNNTSNKDQRNSLKYIDFLKCNDGISFRNYWFLEIRSQVRLAQMFDTIQPKLPLSFAWLLKYFALVINDTSSTLYKEVFDIEKELIKMSK